MVNSRIHTCSSVRNSAIAGLQGEHAAGHRSSVNLKPDWPQKEGRSRQPQPLGTVRYRLSAIGCRGVSRSVPPKPWERSMG
jgi:hypothetical protein